MAVKSLHDKTIDWLKQISAYNQHSFQLDQNRTALLIIDMERFFAHPEGTFFIHGSQEILPNVRSLIDKFRGRKLPVIYTAHVHKAPEIDGGNLTWWWDDYCKEGSPQAEIHEAIRPLPNEKVIFKHRYSAFEGTDLQITLSCLGIRDLVIAGLLTNLCCETTARDAFCKDYRVQFVCDATATSDEELHLATLKNVAYGFAPVVTSAQVLAQLA